MLPSSRILLTGGAGFLGRAIHAALRVRGVPDASILIPRRPAFDLTSQRSVSQLFDEAAARWPASSAYPAAGPTLIIHAAAAVGGIQANLARPAEFFYANTIMALNLAEESLRRGLINPGSPHNLKLVGVGSMTSYPADAPMPLREDSLFRGYPDAASAPYGVAKLALWQALDAYRRQHGLRAAYLVPVNLYGPGDNIDDVRNAHVAGSLVKRFVDATRDGLDEVVCWGTGAPTREFLYIDDAAEAIIRAAELIDEPTPINIAPPLGPDGEVSIRHLAELIARLTGFRGRITWDSTKPDGQPRRCLDVTRASRLLNNWQAQVTLEEGLKRTIEWYRTLTGPCIR